MEETHDEAIATNLSLVLKPTYPKPQMPDPKPEAPNPKPQTLNPAPQILNPQPPTPNPKPIANSDPRKNSPPSLSLSHALSLSLSLSLYPALLLTRWVAMLSHSLALFLTHTVLLPTSPQLHTHSTGGHRASADKSPERLNLVQSEHTLYPKPQTLAERSPGKSPERLETPTTPVGDVSGSLPIEEGGGVLCVKNSD